jgi:regulator of sirC expression with transglutaminase-like and TPR domain
LAIDPYKAFRQAVDRPEENIDLGRAALTIALPDYPDLDVAAYLARIEDLAVEVARCAGVDADIYRSLAALNHVIFTEHGFRGNRDNYFDPKNSFLNQVLERKLGIPISLSVLYLEVGQRVGLNLAGVGFPGHFLVKYSGQSEEIIIDPFSGGEIRSRSDLDRMLREVYGRNVEFAQEFLAPVSKKQILKRMLTNLKAIYHKKNDMVKVLLVLDRLIILDPAAFEEVRDRGLLYLRLECFTQAREDLQTYLRLAPKAEDARAIREKVVNLGNQVTQLH